MHRRPRVHIITPCCRPGNLDTLRQSIRFDMIDTWHIVYDTSHGRSYPGRYTGVPKIVETECDVPAAVGNAARNSALDAIPVTDDDAVVYFLDDDNTMHPRFWEELPAMDATHIYTWDQDNDIDPDSILTGNDPRLRHIDTAMVLAPRTLIGDLRWDLDLYWADGVFIEALVDKHRDRHIYLPQVLCTYNAVAPRAHTGATGTSA